MVTKTKDPNDVLDYEFNWNAASADGGPWLETGDTISTSTWTVETGITKDSDTNTTTTTKIWLSGGTAGNRYLITNRITTANGRTKDQSFIVRVGQG